MSNIPTFQQGQPQELLDFLHSKFKIVQELAPMSHPNINGVTKGSMIHYNHLLTKKHIVCILNKFLDPTHQIYQNNGIS